jgi:hypothetical protein
MRILPVRAAAVAVLAIATTVGGFGELRASGATKTTKSAKSGKSAKPAKPVRAKTQAPVPSSVQKYPDVVSVELVERASGIYDVTATLSSPYDTPQRYADAWRVLDERGNVLGVREILHDHATEQPFTRSLEGVKILSTVKSVEIQGRDQKYGWGGQTKKIDVLRK